MTEKEQKEYDAKKQNALSRNILDIASRNDLYMTKFAPKVQNAVITCLSGGNAKKMINGLIPDAGAEIILAPENAEQLMYFVDSYGKFILQKYHTVYTDQLATGMRLGGGSAPGMVFKQGIDCKLNEPTMVMPYETVDLKTYRVEGYFEQCWKEFVSSGLYTMTAVDLRANANFVYYFRTLIADVIYKEMLRLFWWANYTPFAFAAPTDDIIGTVASYFGTGDGLWRQIEADLTIPYVANVANGGATYLLQEMSGNDAYDLIADCVRKISTRSGVVEIHVTPYIYKSLMEKFAQTSDQNRGALSGRADETNQIFGLYWLSYPIINRLDWGDVIESYFNDGTKYDKPNRVLIYDKRRIAVAYNADILRTSAFSEISFDEKLETVYKRFNHIFDAKYLPSQGKHFVKSY